MIRVLLPAHLRTLAKVEGELLVDVQPRAGEAVPSDISTAISIKDVLDAIEAAHPTLRGTIRDYATQSRRPFLRFFACEEDLSHQPLDTPLPSSIIDGSEPLIILGAIAGG